jgi:hypothetical protein
MAVCLILNIKPCIIWRLSNSCSQSQSCADLLYPASFIVTLLIKRVCSERVKTRFYRVLDGQDGEKAAKKNKHQPV